MHFHMRPSHENLSSLFCDQVRLCQSDSVLHYRDRSGTLSRRNQVCIFSSQEPLAHGELL